ncbi:MULTISPECIES: UDP-N-acetylmuramoylalanyl-D-glutamyl-2,6-diaminopimelate--D-alanyl-D-alanine ligase [unclassified Beijerinckia]|uniref:UDP-N-acetylmuramoylalanyl-D-glutamyl-2, 6-diaminopimelate--D-alanyl-D-alanine ligase n=1 Tax=unclassified Beijerinckia TaxID=2638183 RepID=UPI000894E6AD|nr:MULTISPECIES: UDP-N-acetylmuramoylalanyl-D-glutamyl-2,6-diaminopimelate--D-alanyl-D-alanine ligase [unclassified Beijerinckia]MDH7799593.1 UDP-N-acetylmuramoyl-tripeptide--D-alanyl-D-alanine ligase [Beijerinckia sp. GAS462]SEB47380.1 UDP-N-acetylmuramoyl-tripeptide--D-alanyl-D-alanine ligase [Beijerinckia sp. 28-YEA-48]
METPELWSSLGLFVPLQARMSGTIPHGVTGISIDTRSLQPGDLFFAIKGENSDGHDYVAMAFDKGAAAAVIDEAHSNDLRGLGSLYVVNDVLPAMERLGRAARERSPAGIVAVTGSVGKTSTKEALRVALSRFGETHASAASYNNHWGVPLTLARMPREAQFGVFEIGMNHAGEITPLVDMVRPHVAIVTTVAPVHLEYFASIDEIAEAKAEIFGGLEANGVAIIHRDVAQFDLLNARAQAATTGNVWSFGLHAEANARLISSERDGDGSRVQARVLGRDITYFVGAPGVHLAMNSLAVLLTSQAFGLELDDAAAAMASFSAPSGRGQTVTLNTPGGDVTLIDESYNANPTSMRAALALLGQTPVASGGRRIAILGDMLELGTASPELHRDLAADIEAAAIDLVFASGPMMKHLFDALPERLRQRWSPTSAGLTDAVLEAVGGGDAVMIKGSNGSRMAPIVAALKEAHAPKARGVDATC